MQVQDKKNELSLQLGVALVGLTLLVSPLNWKYKIIASAVFGLSNSTVALREYRNYRRFKPAIAEQLKQLQEAKRERDVLLSEVEARKAQVEAELARKQSQVIIGEADLIASQSEARRELQQAIDDLERQKEKLKEAITKSQHEANLLKLNAEIEAEEITASILEQADAKLRGADRQLSDVLELEAEVYRAYAQNKAKARQRRNRTFNRIKKIIVAIRGKHELEALQIQNEKAIALATIQGERDQWKNIRQQEEEAREAQFMDSLNAKIAYAQEQLTNDAQQAIAEQVKAQVQPYLLKIEQQEKYIELLRDQLDAARENTKAMHLPKLPDRTDALHTLARRLIEFYQKRGVVLDFVNAYQTFTDVHIIVIPNPHHYPDGKGFENNHITKHFDLLIPEFKLREDVEGGWGGDGYDIRLIPMNFSFLGMVPLAPNNEVVKKAFIDPYTAREDVDDGPIESLPTIPDSIADDSQGVKEAIADNELSKIMDEMIGFLPPSVPFTEEALTPLEIKTVDWFYRWRKLATRGAQPNITALPDLISRIYGDKPVRSNRTLTNRLKKIFKHLNLEIASS